MEGWLEEARHRVGLRLEVAAIARTADRGFEHLDRDDATRHILLVLVDVREPARAERADIAEPRDLRWNG